MKNKKGMVGFLTNPFFWIILIVTVVAIVAVPKLVRADSTLTNPYTPVTPDCKPKDIGINIKGNTIVENSAFFETEPSIQKVEISSVKTGKSLIFSEDFKIRVQAIDPFSNNVVAEDNSNQQQIDNADVTVPYSLSFYMPDNDCDGKIDDFDLILKSELFAEDPGDVKENKLSLEFRNGRFN